MPADEPAIRAWALEQAASARSASAEQVDLVAEVLRHGIATRAAPEGRATKTALERRAA